MDGGRSTVFPWADYEWHIVGQCLSIPRPLPGITVASSQGRFQGLTCKDGGGFQADYLRGPSDRVAFSASANSSDICRFRALAILIRLFKETFCSPRSMAPA